MFFYLSIELVTNDMVLLKFMVLLNEYLMLINRPRICMSRDGAKHTRGMNVINRDIKYNNRYNFPRCNNICIFLHTCIDIKYLDPYAYNRTAEGLCLDIEQKK